jgi:NhaA family Na+:H+ antiporter
LILGAGGALLWANTDRESYHHFVHRNIFPDFSLLHFVNDVLMAFFFAIATKEVWESLLPGGALSEPKRAATPLMATVGGVVVPACLYLLGCHLTGQMDTLGRGWAIPCATDIAFSYLVARIVFGAGHPAIAFLLLLAIADDAAGLLILAVAYPTGTLQPLWLAGSVIAVVAGLLMRRSGVRSFWWYLIGPGLLSWWSFHQAGIHAALGLVPIIPTMPHAARDTGLFVDSASDRSTLTAFQHWWKNPVELILGLFGLVNAGVVFANSATATWLVLIGLVVGKPLGITLFTLIGEKLLGMQMPVGMSYRHIVTLGVVAGIGFTVALFVSTAAFPEPGPIQDAAKMGALGSFASALLAIPIGWLLKAKLPSRT